MIAAGSRCPWGTNGANDMIYIPTVTQFTEKNAQTNASNADKARTKPVALRTKYPPPPTPSVAAAGLRGGGAVRSQGRGVHLTSSGTEDSADLKCCVCDRARRPPCGECQRKVALQNIRGKSPTGWDWAMRWRSTRYR